MDGPPRTCDDFNAIENATTQQTVNSPCCSPPREFSFTTILRHVVQAREYQTALSLVSSSNEAESSLVKRFWYNLFQNAFVSPNATHRASAGSQDDLLFFVGHRLTPVSKPPLKVSRKNNSKLPQLQDRSIDWEETVYLNLLMQYCVYVVNVAVCTRTGPQELQILHKCSQTVFACPSSRRMDTKGCREEFIYPDVCFSVDDFEEAFSTCILRDSECLCVELTAYDLNGQLQGVCFLGSVQYSALKSLHDSQHASQQSVAKFIRMIGAQSKGLVELSVSVVNEAPEYQCMHPDGVNLISKCCSCGTTSQNNAWSSKFNRFAGETITQQHLSNWPEQCLPDEDFFDWVLLSNTPDIRDTRCIGFRSLAPMRPLPSSAQSAGASVNSSPLMRRRVSSFSVNELTDVDRKSGSLRVRSKMVVPRDSTDRPPSRIATILSQFASTHTTSRPGDIVSHSRSNTMQSNVKTDSLTVLDAPHGRPLQVQTERQNRGSFGQSWSWLNERRRATSLPLRAAVTFLTLSCHDLLLDLAEVRRDPILNIAD